MNISYILQKLYNRIKNKCIDLKHLDSHVIKLFSEGECSNVEYCSKFYARILENNNGIIATTYC